MPHYPFQLSSARSLERRHGLRWQRDGADTLGRLLLLKAQFVKPHNRERAAYTKRRALEVNVRPFEPEKFSATKARRDCQKRWILQRIAAQPLEQ